MSDLPIGLLDEGGDLGQVIALDIIGDKALASIPRDQEGVISVSSFYKQSTNADLGFAQISGNQTYDVNASLMTHDLNLDSGNVLTYSNSTTKITFPASGRFIVIMTVKSTWSDAFLCDTDPDPRFVPQAFGFTPVLRNSGGTPITSNSAITFEGGGAYAVCGNTGVTDAEDKVAWPSVRNSTTAFFFGYISVGVNYTLDLFDGKFHTTSYNPPVLSTIDVSVTQLREILWVP